MLEQGLEKRFLGLEVLIKGPLADIGALGDILDFCPIDAFLREKRQGDIQQSLPRARFSTLHP